MLNLRHLILLAVASVAAQGAMAGGLTGTSADYGSPVANAAADRSVTVSLSTTHINVNNGETVWFALGDRGFEWHFDTFADGTVVDLAKIAPPGAQLGKVLVHVARNPLYRG
ncbi:CzcE family metal-binding protein [Undibacterium sp. TJN25]|uniref:CzcE family metal-binding protein n=1 Tax=Undibacterium sp. TJN25 TaxID=3413056 RepID=UPI003BEFB2D5